MSGVIDWDGQQWEHCGVCQEFIRIQDLLYERPTQKLPYGRDICDVCIALSEQEKDELADSTSRRLAKERYQHYLDIGWDVTLNDDLSISIHSCGS